MNFLISLLQTPAPAAPGAGNPLGNYSFLIMMVLLFALMWLFMIRPQQKKQKELREMRKLMGTGDKVITQGGIFGTIVEVKDTYFVIEVDQNVKIRVAKDLVFRDVSDVQQVR